MAAVYFDIPDDFPQEWWERVARALLRFASRQRSPQPLQARRRASRPTLSKAWRR
jgi:hypothetical protein